MSKMLHIDEPACIHTHTRKVIKEAFVNKTPAGSLDTLSFHIVEQVPANVPQFTQTLQLYFQECCDLV